MKRFFFYMRKSTFFIFLLLISFALIIVFTRNTKVDSKDYSLNIMNETILVHELENYKSYHLIKNEDLSDEYVTILLFAIFENENCPIHLSIDSPSFYIVASTSDGVNASIVRASTFNGK